jgi:2-dehydropantoate 2-reductase
VKSCSLEELSQEDLESTDVIILAAKSTATNDISKQLSALYLTCKKKPYILSIQNGVENEEILCKYFPKQKVIGGLTRKIGAHIIKPGVVEVAGTAVETIIGAWEKRIDDEDILKSIEKDIKQSNLKCEVVEDIKLELWKKLVINNGVNAICALLHVKTGIVMHHEKISKIVYGLMSETAIAGEKVGVSISKANVDAMFNLISNFDSIKPSMLVDREYKRPLEIDEICGIVIRYCEALGKDAPYTRTVATLLEFVYEQEV